MVLLDADQIATLAEAIPEPWGVYIYTAAFTGARSGELCGLRVKHLDLLRRRITVSESLADIAGKLQFGTTKNGEDRTFAIPPFLAEMLGAYLNGRPNDPDALVFTAPRGGPLRHNDWYKKHFRPTVDLLVARGKDPLNRKPAFPEHLEGLTFHSLRHSCASMLIAAGENPVAISKQLGHRKVSTTMDIYAGLFADADEGRAAKLENVYRAAKHHASANGEVAELHS
jgi:integrase